MKKLSAVALCLMLVVLTAFAPISVQAGTDTPTDRVQPSAFAESVTIWGLALDSATEYYHNGTDGELGTVTDVKADNNAHYDPSTGTLVLNGLNVQSFDNSTDGALCAYGDITIVLNGISTIITDGSVKVNTCGVFIDGSLTVRGDGMLTATGSATKYLNYGVRASGSITVNSGTLTGRGKASLQRVSGKSYGVFSGNSITVDGGTIEGNGGGTIDSIDVLNYDSESCGVFAAQDISITVNGGKITGTTATTRNGNNYGVRALNGDITVNGGSITGTGCDGMENCGVYADNGNIKASGGSITGTGGQAINLSCGMFAGNSITADRGTIEGIGHKVWTDNSESVGIWAHNDITANAGGSIEGDGGSAQGKDTTSCGVRAESGAITANADGSITGIGGNTYYSFGMSSKEQINFAYGAKALATAYSQAFTGSDPLTPPNLNGGTAAASTTYKDLAPGSYDVSLLTTCKFFRIPAALSTPQPAVTPQSSFARGQAPTNETVTVDVASDPDFSAMRCFGSAAIDGTPIDLGRVGTPGTDGSVENGSIVIRLNKTYLDGLSVGAHTLIINLKGVYTGQSVKCTLTVTPAPTVTSVIVDPASVSIQKGRSQAFFATVTGERNPAQTVNWTVEGGAAGTSIGSSGLLTIAANETSTMLTVKATSTVDTTQSGTATVTVTAPSDPDLLKEHQIIRGVGGEWTDDDSSGLEFTADVDYAKFTGVSVDGTALSSDKYTSRSGSTIVTLKASYLQTLSNGRHTLRISFSDGYAQTSFTTKAAFGVPATGDNSQLLLWLSFVLLTGAGLIMCHVLGRKRRRNG